MLSPRSHVNWSTGTKRLAQFEEPVFFLHRLQWQYWKPRYGPLMRYATSPHTQDP
jgi:hypothetical protein